MISQEISDNRQSSPDNTRSVSETNLSQAVRPSSFPSSTLPSPAKQRTKVGSSSTRCMSSSFDVRHLEALQRLEERKELITSLDTDIRQVEKLLKEMKGIERTDSISCTKDDDSANCSIRTVPTS